MNPIATTLIAEKVDWKVVGKVLLMLLVVISLFYFFRKFTTPRIVHDDMPYRRCDGSVTTDDVRKIGTLIQDAHRTLSTTAAPAFVSALLPSAWMDWIFDKAYTVVGGASERCKVLQEVSKLNNNQFIAFHNAYKNTFRGTTFKTDLNAIGFTGCTDSWYAVLQNKLNYLKLP